MDVMVDEVGPADVVYRRRYRAVVICLAVATLGGVAWRVGQPAERSSGQTTFAVCRGDVACDHTLAVLSPAERVSLLTSIAQVNATQAQANATAQAARATRAACWARGGSLC